MTQLQLVIRLSQNCMAAFDCGDVHEARRLMRIRDAEYLKLDAIEAHVFGRWYELTPEELAAVMKSESPS